MYIRFTFNLLDISCLGAITITSPNICLQMATDTNLHNHKSTTKQPQPSTAVGLDIAHQHTHPRHPTQKLSSSLQNYHKTTTNNHNKKITSTNPPHCS